MISRVRKKTSSSPKEALPFATFVQRQYWPAAKATLSAVWADTVEHYHLPTLIKEFGASPLADIEAEQVERWWGVLLQSNLAPATANKRLFRLKHIFKKAVEWGYRADNPARGIRKQRESRGRVKWLSNAQRDQLVQRANPELRLYLVAAQYTGARRRSLLELREQDVDFERSTVTFRATKNGEDYSVPLHPKLRELLQERLTGQPEAYLLPRYTAGALSRAFKRLALRSGLTDYRFHDLRHDLATRLACHGANQRLIMDVLGHRDPRASVRYTHLSHAAIKQTMEACLG
ncbi:tyrosine-type recombinase/integrase [Nitrospira sp. BLG_1]|uniref:tyrosine-type recombinase/integrase n=1 Tax=Nitrospira sp. BLG_1 TaxID=3395883 RepID=UPI0039BC4C26